MTEPNTLLLHVADMTASTACYTNILGRKPVQVGEDFSLFLLASGMGLGLWRRDVIDPPANDVTGSIEIGFKQSHDAVEVCHAAWLAQGVAILMPPTDRPFGRSFVAQDPDGHRLRVYSLNG